MPLARLSLRLLPMANPPLVLQAFLRSVPACESTATLEEIQAIFAAGQDDVIIALSEQGAPLGAIDMKSLMPHLVCRLKVSAGRTAAEPFPGESTPDRAPFDLRVLMRPIAILPGAMDVSDFLSYLRSGQLGETCNYTCALVDRKGKFQGLLDSWELLKTLLPTQENLQLSETYFPYSIHLATLFQLLDKLPIPLMLQTSQGQVRHQNRAWRDRIGKSSHQSGAVLSANEGYGNSANSWCSPIRDRDPLAIDGLLEKPTSSLDEGDVPPSHPSKPRSAPGEVWQFIKFPLDLSGDWELGEGRADLTEPADRIATRCASVWLTLATDITEQRQLCKELAAKNADLMQLNRLKDEFLACISHELKTPLTAVLGLSSLLKDRKLGELTQRQARYAQLIYQSGRQLMTVVNDILDLTRLEAGQLKLTLKPFKLKEVCDRAYQQAAAHLLARHRDENEPPIRFTLEIEPGLTTIVADELRLRQMLVHLLDNALKFTPAGGEIGLKVSRWQDWIELTVWDTGIGIPEASQHLIFQKFQQLESPLTRQHEGTGLGLVLTQRLARAHGGDISFISQAGQGSQFTLLLPPDPQPQTAVNSSAGTPRRGSALPPTSPPYKPLVLIVESAPQYIEQLNERLQALSYRVAIARSGTEALEKARQLQPCVIFLNPELPLLSGWDVLILLKADPRTQNIPAIVMSAVEEQELARHNGANGFLNLPIEKVALQESLYRLGEQIDPNHSGLTILRLSPGGLRTAEELSLFLTEADSKSSGLASLNYRILSTDDLEQADILGRVWNPDVLLLEGISLEDPAGYLRSLSQHDHLAALPLITLDAKITEIANKIGGLSVFPCLAGLERQGAGALLQVIQIAAGLSDRLRVLIVSQGVSAASVSAQESAEDSCVSKTSPDLHALKDDLQKAGFTSDIAPSWSDVFRQIKRQKVDVIILELGERSLEEITAEEPSSPPLRDALKRLAQLPMKPPLFVLDRRQSQGSEPIDAELESQLEDIATTIWRSPSPAWDAILEQLHEMLVGRSPARFRIQNTATQKQATEFGIRD